MKKIKLISVFVIVLFTYCNINAQKITKFKHEVFKTSEGRTKLKVIPVVIDQTTRIDIDKITYAILLCYKINGKKRGKLLYPKDQILKNGVFIHSLALGKTSRVSDLRVKFFNSLDTPKKDFPTKMECFK